MKTKRRFLRGGVRFWRGSGEGRFIGRARGTERSLTTHSLKTSCLESSV